MKCEIQEFIGYLHNTRGTSKNTEISYERDLRKLEQFLMREGIQDVDLSLIHISSKTVDNR